MDSLPLALVINALITAVGVGVSYGKMSQRQNATDENVKRLEDENKEIKVSVASSLKENQGLAVGFAEVRIEIRQLIEAQRNSQEFMRTMQESIRDLQSRLMRKK